MVVPVSCLKRLDRYDGLIKHVLSGVFNQQFAERLPIKLRIQCLAQTIVKVLQPGKGGSDPQAFDIITGGQSFQHKQWIQLYKRHLTS